MDKPAGKDQSDVPENQENRITFFDRFFSVITKYRLDAGAVFAVGIYLYVQIGVMDQKYQNVNDRYDSLNKLLDERKQNSDKEIIKNSQDIEKSQEEIKFLQIELAKIK